MTNFCKNLTKKKHETGCGIIEKLGKCVDPSLNLKIGDHVVLSYSYCQDCPSCKKGKPWACDLSQKFFDGFRADDTTPARITLDGQKSQKVATMMRQGSFAEYAVVDQTAVVKVGKDLDLKMLAPLGKKFLFQSKI